MLWGLNLLLFISDDANKRPLDGSVYAEKPPDRLIRSGLNADHALIGVVLSPSTGQSGRNVVPGKPSTVNEHPHPARLRQGLHHEEIPPHRRTDNRKLKTGEQLLAQSKTVADIGRALAEGFC